MSDENNNNPFGDGSSQARRLLGQLNEAALHLLKEQPAQARKHGAVVYLGNVHDAVPRALVRDPYLEPVDQMAWQHIRIEAHSGLMPDYDDLAVLLKASRPTVSRSLTMLRLTRWLSQQPVRDSLGRMRGSVYALHDEPASLADAFTLDSRYMHLIKEARRHTVIQVRRVAELIYDDIARQLGEAPDRLLLSPSQTERYGVRLAQSHEQGKPVTSASSASRLLTVRRHLEHTAPPVDNSASPATVALAGTELNNLTQSKAGQNTELNYLTQSSEALSQKTLLSDPGAPGTELNNFTQSLTRSRLRDPVGSLGSSSKDLDPVGTTTNTNPTPSPDPRTEARVPADWPDNLIWPKELGLNDNQRHLLWALLGELPLQTQQEVLDEAAGTVKARQHGANPVNHVFGYVRAMAANASQGKFAFTALGERYRAARLGGRDSVTGQPLWKQEGFRSEADCQRFLQAYQAQGEAVGYEEFLGQWFGRHPEALDPKAAGFASDSAVNLCHNDWRAAGRSVLFPQFVCQWLKQHPGLKG